MKLLFSIAMFVALFGTIPSATGAFPFTEPSTLDALMLTDSVGEQTPSIDSDGHATTIVVWERLTDTPLAAGGNDNGYGTNPGSLNNQTIFYKRSVDFGQTWTPAAPLAPQGTADDGDDLKPVLATDKKGTWIAAWYGKRSVGNPSHYRRIYFTRSTDDGLSWSAIAPLNPNPPNHDELSPALATDGNGNWVAVWFDISPSRVIVYSRSADNGQTWSNAVTLTTQSTYYTDPRVKFIGNHSWLITLEGNVDFFTQFNLYKFRSTNDGATFAEYGPLETAPTWDASPEIGADGNGNVVVGWMSTPTNVSANGTFYEMKYARSTDYGATWTSPQVAASVNSYGPFLFAGNTIHILKDGTWVWNYTGALPGGPGDLDILYMQSLDQGAHWSYPVYINQTCQDDNVGDQQGYNGLSMTSNQQSQILLVWNSYSHAYDGGPVDPDILVARSTQVSNLPIKILTPTNGLILQGDSPLDIHWQTDPLIAGTAVRFELLDSHDVFFGYLEADWDPDGDGVARLTIPLVPEGHDYVLRARSAWDTSIFADTTGLFSITGGPLKVVAPNGGENWQRDSLQQLHWRSNLDYAGEAIAAELWDNNGLVADLGTDWSPTGEGSLLFAVPHAAPGSNYKIRIASVWDSSFTDMSDMPFTISDSTVQAHKNTAVPPDAWTVYP